MQDFYLWWSINEFELLSLKPAGYLKLNKLYKHKQEHTELSSYKDDLKVWVVFAVMFLAIRKYKININSF